MGKLHRKELRETIYLMILASLCSFQPNRGGIMERRCLGILLIILGLVVISITPITHYHSHRLLTFFMDKLFANYTAIFYTLPTILSGILWVIGLFGVPLVGAGMMVVGIYYGAIDHE